MADYVLKCPNCGNSEDFRKEVTDVVAISRIHPVISDSENYLEDFGDIDVYSYPDDKTGGWLKVICNRCEHVINHDLKCNDEAVLIEYAIKKGYVEVTDGNN